LSARRRAAREDPPRPAAEGRRQQGHPAVLPAGCRPRGLLFPGGPRAHRLPRRPASLPGRRRGEETCGVARGWSPLCRLSAPVRVAWPAMLAVIVVLGGVACGGGTKAR